MIALREFPPNPHAVVYHLDERLTDQIVETYLPGSARPPRDWAASALELPGMRVLSLNPYKIRVQKQKDAAWGTLLERFEAILRAELAVLRIEDLVESESRQRTFCWHGAPLDRRVYEGRLQAQESRVAAALFALPGVAEVSVDGNRIQIRKCPMHPWRELAPLIEETLAGC